MLVALELRMNVRDDGQCPEKSDLRRDEDDVSSDCQSWDRKSRVGGDLVTNHRPKNHAT